MTTGFVNVSGAPHDDGAGEEAATVFSAIEAQAGDFGQLVRLRLLYTDRSHFAPLHAVRQPFFTARLAGDDYPATTGVITGGRGDGYPLLDAQAVLGPAKQAVYAPEVWRSVQGQAAPLPVSHGTAYDGVLFVSGQVAYDQQARVSGETVAEQLDVAFANLDAILRAAGASRGAVAAFTVYVVESAFPDHDDAVAHFTRLARERCGAELPVVSWVGVKELFQPGLLVEVEAAVSVDAPVRRSAPASSLAGVPPSTVATSTGAWCFATAAIDADADACGAATAANAVEILEAGLADLGLTKTALRTITAWCAPAGWGTPVATALQAALPGVAVLAVPLTIPGDGAGRLVLEASGRVGG